ncbi:MAG: hypothetical protein M3O22_01480 [Pseudomonadota bacterium]|nr:hypothetical protein [Pseudomonadota bacterium]
MPDFDRTALKDIMDLCLGPGIDGHPDPVSVCLQMAQLMESLDAMAQDPGQDGQAADAQKDFLEPFFYRIRAAAMRYTLKEWITSGMRPAFGPDDPADVIEWKISWISWLENETGSKVFGLSREQFIALRNFAFLGQIWLEDMLTKSRLAEAEIYLQETSAAETRSGQNNCLLLADAVLRQAGYTEQIRTLADARQASCWIMRHPARNWTLDKALGVKVQESAVAPAAVPGT